MEKRINCGSPLFLPYHHRESENPEAPGLHDPHTHVILPGTFFEEGAGERSPLYFSRNKQVNHIELLHRTTEQTLRELMDIHAGLDWEQRYDALEAVREQQRAITETKFHGYDLDEQGRRWEMWIGQRRTDEEHTAVGYYRRYPIDAKSTQTTFEANELSLEFRPLASGLSHINASMLAEVMTSGLQTQGNTLDAVIQLALEVNAMNSEERQQLFTPKPAEVEIDQVDEQPIDPPDKEPPARSRPFDISFF